MASKENDIFNKEKVCKDWNEFFPELNMRVSDLTNPTEAFLTKTLVFYLRAFGFEVDPPGGENFETENGREKRLFLIKLTRNIEYMLQITHKSLNFSYYELIKPTHKKTTYMLSVLLNYLCFFNMYKHDVVAMAESRIKLREELLSKIADVKQEAERRHERSKSLKSDITEANAAIDKITLETEKLDNEIEIVQETVEKLSNEVCELDLKSEALQAQQRHWQKLIVSESEVSEMLLQMKKLKGEITAYQKEAADHEVSLKEHKLSITSDELSCKLITEAQEVVPKKMLVEHKEITKELELVSKQFAIEENKKQEFLNSIEQQNQKLELIAQQLEAAKKQFEQEKQPILRSIKKKEQLVVNYKTKLELHSTDIQEVDVKITKQIEIGEALKLYIDDSLSRYKIHVYKT